MTAHEFGYPGGRWASAIQEEDGTVAVRESAFAIQEEDGTVAVCHVQVGRL